jgi:enamine deaminase RidA (YjgF/YER057c/UK114 family)
MDGVVVHGLEQIASRTPAGNAKESGMLRLLNPDTIAKPFSSYSHVVAAPEGCRWLHVSGQVGAAPDGTIPESFEAQARQTWANVLAAVRAGGMAARDIVKVTTYITRREDIPAVRTIRDEALQGHRSASTMVIVSGLAAPSLLIEVEVIAAQAVPVAQAAKPQPAAKAKPAAKARAVSKPRGAKTAVKRSKPAKPARGR